MSEVSFKERVRLTIIEMSKQYKEKYVDYEYLICSSGFKNKPYYIVDAEKDNYQHLTGVHSALSASDFFEKCYSGTLDENDFDFNKNGQSEKEVKGTVRRKIKVLPNMMTMFENAVNAEEDFQKNKVSCSFATADGKCTLGFTDTNKARPKSLISGNELSNPAQVELVLRKKAGNDFFDEIVYGDKVSLTQYREKIEDILSEDLKNT